MTQRQVAGLAGLNPQRICKAERGQSYPRHSHLQRILAGMGVTFAALHRAQELVLDPMGEAAEPIDAPHTVRAVQRAGPAECSPRSPGSHPSPEHRAFARAQGGGRETVEARAGRRRNGRAPCAKILRVA
jgi:transcriptional regulator with XRE-family HTH domain